MKITLTSPVQPPSGAAISEIKAGLFIVHSDKMVDLHILSDARAKHVLPLWRGADYDTQIGLLSSAAELEAVIITRVSAANASGELAKCFQV